MKDNYLFKMGTCCTRRETIEIERMNKSYQTKLISNDVNLNTSSHNKSIDEMSINYSIKGNHQNQNNHSGPILKLLMKNCQNE